MNPSGRTSVSSSAFPAIAAEGPHPEHAQQLMLFGQFVGDWDIRGTLIDAAGNEHRRDAEWLFAWALEGRAIQDVLISPPRAATGDPRQRFEFGTTIRFYDAGRDVWQITYITPIGRQVHRLTGRQEGDEIVLSGRRNARVLQRWVFSSIGPDTFTWRGYYSRDTGTTWVQDEEMYARKRH